MKDPPQDYACNLDHVGRSPVCTSAKMPLWGFLLQMHGAPV
jgi:hypothetical protein